MIAEPKLQGTIPMSLTRIAPPLSDYCQQIPCTETLFLLYSAVVLFSRLLSTSKCAWLFLRRCIYTRWRKRGDFGYLFLPGASRVGEPGDKRPAAPDRPAVLELVSLKCGKNQKVPK